MRVGARVDVPPPQWHAPDRLPIVCTQTLDLLFRMTNPVNVEVVTSKLLTFLRGSVDVFLRKDLVSRITQVAER